MNQKTEKTLNIIALILGSILGVLFVAIVVTSIIGITMFEIPIAYIVSAALSMIGLVFYAVIKHFTDKKLFRNILIISVVLNFLALLIIFINVVLILIGI